MKFYPQAAPTTPVTLAQIVKRIEKRSTVSSADVKAVLDALQYEVIEALENGNTVRLGDIGSFRLTIKAEGAATAVEAKTKGAKLIKQVNVQFTKSTVMRDSFDVRNLDFAPQEDRIFSMCREHRFQGLKMHLHNTLIVSTQQKYEIVL